MRVAGSPEAPAVQGWPATPGLGAAVPLPLGGREESRRAHLPALIWTLVRTDVKVRYHGSLGGFGWALLKPLSMFFVLLGVFSLIFAPTNPHYALNLILGLFLWEFFSEGTKTGLLSLYVKRYLLTKSQVPRWLVVVASSANAIITLLAFTAVILLYLAWAGRFPSPSRLLLFLGYLIEMWLIVVGLSLAMSALYLRYRDLTHLWDAVSQAGFFVAPIVFPIDALPGGAQPYLYLWPPTPVIEFSQRVLIAGTTPSPAANLALLAAALSILALGALVFRRSVPRAVEHL
jgi:ABC-type polysaccharide/polyol phosphate export permease